MRGPGCETKICSILICKGRQVPSMILANKF